MAFLLYHSRKTESRRNRLREKNRWRRFPQPLLLRGGPANQLPDRKKPRQPRPNRLRVCRRRRSLHVSVGIHPCPFLFSNRCLPSPVAFSQSYGFPDSDAPGWDEAVWVPDSGSCRLPARLVPARFGTNGVSRQGMDGRNPRIAGIRPAKNSRKSSPGTETTLPTGVPRDDHHPAGPGNLGRP